MDPKVVIILLLITGLLTASVYDIKTMCVPFWLILCFIILAAVSVVTEIVHHRSREALLTVMFSLIPLLLIVMSAPLHVEFIGTADGIIIFVIGAVMGTAGLVAILTLSFIISGLGSAFCIILGKKNRKDKIPLVPFLTVGTIAGVYLLV
ncbi:MAG: prepilin peptidase [Lachnospiraceae bacterium]|nr:prepilin peptidase [Lachnospiraceae bacterium]